MQYVNIPWTQVVLAVCAVATLLIVLGTLIWKGGAMSRDVQRILTNHLPHIERKVDRIMFYMRIPPEQEPEELIK